MIILTQEEASKALLQHKYVCTAELLTWAALSGVNELGSGSINRKYAVGLSEIRDCMLREFNITTNALNLHQAWEAAGDPDTYFYFGGRQHFSNALSEEVTVFEYIVYLSTIVGKLSDQARHDLEGFVGALIPSLKRTLPPSHQFEK